MLGQAIDDWLARVARSYKNPKSTAIRERALRVHFAPLHYRDAASITVSEPWRRKLRAKRTPPFALFSIMSRLRLSRMAS